MRLGTAFELASGLRDRIDEVEGVEKIVCPPFVLPADRGGGADDVLDQGGRAGRALGG